jgi:hypothetical protein
MSAGSDAAGQGSWLFRPQEKEPSAASGTVPRPVVMLDSGAAEGSPPGPAAERPAPMLYGPAALAGGNDGGASRKKHMHKKHEKHKKHKKKHKKKSSRIL